VKKRGEVCQRFAQQQWMIDKVIQTTGPDICWPMSSIAVGSAGPDVAGDIASIRNNVKKYDDVSGEYARIAVKRQELAKRAEDEGHLVTAGDNYYAASVFYGFAMFPIHEDGNETNIAYNTKKVECYDKFIKYSQRPIKKVEVPFEGKTLPAILHLPTNVTGKVPCVLDITGMDAFKEQQNPLCGEKLLARGMAVFALDIPGQGECLIRGIKCTAENVARAGKAALDYLEQCPEIDATRIAVSGISFGSFWVTLMAAYDNRFKAMAGRLFCHEPGFNTIFNVSQPAYKARFIWMAGYENEAEFDKFTRTLTWQGQAKNIKCPTLLIGGEFDELSPVEYSYDLFNEIQAPKKMVIYKGQTHSLHNSYVDSATLAADWIKDRLEGKPMQSEIIYLDAMCRQTKK
jgi:dipeptidyl aminopeptidase/acylaminoacyl peptidase